MPNDARIEELIAQVVQYDGGKTTVHERLREALRTAMREAREEQIRKDAEILRNLSAFNESAGYRIASNILSEARLHLVAQLPTTPE